MSLMSLLLSLHVIAAITWIGGIFLIDLFLAPVLRRHLTDPAARLSIIHALFRGFFAWVWLAGAALLSSGYWAVFRFGGFAALSPAMWVMVAGGSFMVLLALYVFFFPFLALHRAVRAADWPGAAKAAGQIRWLSSVNLVLAVPVVLAGVRAFHG
ncbi:hypothetical protein [Acidocella aromatica]|uniref:Putative membrane protein n=1 Tax=Acidocella aromatica TaxID=1303579 RepID=A0A840VC73_9PROT|nr:hypothetical protein [Acidocella aromatica]MBB5373393.1 putative membrane protein [Acidocella aromatica]